MKLAVIAFVLVFSGTMALAEEPAAPAAEHEGGEHAEKKPPPGKPGLPITEVQKLPVVAAWRKWEKDQYDSDVITWGEKLDSVEGKQCWGVALGETHYDGLHVWRHFCVPIESGEIWVQKLRENPEDDIIYMPYGKWVTECKPTQSYPGDC